MLKGMLRNAGEANEAEELLLSSQFHSAVILELTVKIFLSLVDWF